MTSKEIMQDLAKMRNALYNMVVCRDQTMIVGNCIMCLDKILTEMNKYGTNDEPQDKMTL